jgi:hypothetical protein
MIEEYVSDLANQMGLKLSRVSAFERKLSGCIEGTLLNIKSGGKTVSEFVLPSELAYLHHDSSSCDSLELKVRAALKRLKIQLEP